MARSCMVVAVAMLAMLAVAQSAPDCDSAATALLPCYSYVTGSDVKPPTDCCGGLSSLNTNSPTCLCQLITQLNGTAASDPSLNVTKAYTLPKDCAITLKSSDCPALANLPLSPPAGTPALPTTSTAGPTGGPATPLKENDAPRLLPTIWAMSMAAVAVGLQAMV